MKRLFLLFFSAMLCTAVSAHDFYRDGIYYNITSSSKLTVEVTYEGDRYNDYNNEYSGSVVIPEKVTYYGKEYSVTSIGELAFYECSRLTSVTIPNSTGKSWKLNANDMCELQDMVAETLDMERGTSKAETGLDHLERNDFIIQKQKQEMEEAEKAKKNAVLEKKIAEIKTQTALKEKARLDNEIATINKKVIEAQNECDSLDEKYDGLVEKYNSLVNTYNDTLRDLNAWRGAADWQKFMFDTLSETYYQGNEIVKYAVDSLISFAKNDDGRGGHQDFLHDDQSVAIKHTLLMVNASDKSVWQKVAAWLLSLAKRFGNLTMTQLQRASRQLDDVVNGKYDWRISKFMEKHGLSW